MIVSKPLVIMGIGAFLVIPALIAVAIQFENRDVFCASCHTEPESEYYSRTLMQPSDLASSHSSTEENIRCIDCHSAEGISGRIGSLSQGTSDLIAYLTGNYQQPTIIQHPIGDQACTKCHIAPGNSASQPSEKSSTTNSHYHLEAYLSEWKARTAIPVGTCSLCHISHNDNLEENDNYVEVSSANTACDQCHRTLSGWIPPN